eukprot:GHVN01079984.1.p1 GENE.GHVN01079984.1~~GHVN01079984.1.p1  ORF type:complete len:1250 (+),score=224.44 GHVN01079984.1:2-3751(+)
MNAGLEAGGCEEGTSGPSSSNEKSGLCEREGKGSADEGKGGGLFNGRSEVDGGARGRSGARVRGNEIRTEIAGRQVRKSFQSESVGPSGGGDGVRTRQAAEVNSPELQGDNRGSQVSLSTDSRTMLVKECGGSEMRRIEMNANETRTLEGGGDGAGTNCMGQVRKESNVSSPDILRYPSEGEGASDLGTASWGGNRGAKMRMHILGGGNVSSKSIGIVGSGERNLYQAESVRLTESCEGEVRRELQVKERDNSRAEATNRARRGSAVRAGCGEESGPSDDVMSDVMRDVMSETTEGSQQSSAKTPDSPLFAVTGPRLPANSVSNVCEGVGTSLEESSEVVTELSWDLDKQRVLVVKGRASGKEARGVWVCGEGDEVLSGDSDPTRGNTKMEKREMRRRHQGKDHRARGATVHQSERINRSGEARDGASDERKELQVEGGEEREDGSSEKEATNSPRKGSGVIVVLGVSGSLVGGAESIRRPGGESTTDRREGGSVGEDLCAGRDGASDRETATTNTDSNDELIDPVDHVRDRCFGSETKGSEAHQSTPSTFASVSSSSHERRNLGKLTHRKNRTNNGDPLFYSLPYVALPNDFIPLANVVVQHSHVSTKQSMSGEHEPPVASDRLVGNYLPFIPVIEKLSYSQQYHSQIDLTYRETPRMLPNPSPREGEDPLSGCGSHGVFFSRRAVVATIQATRNQHSPLKSHSRPTPVPTHRYTRRSSRDEDGENGDSNHINKESSKDVEASLEPVPISPTTFRASSLTRVTAPSTQSDYLPEQQDLTTPPNSKRKASDTRISQSPRKEATTPLRSCSSFEVSNPTATHTRGRHFPSFLSFGKLLQISWTRDIYGSRILVDYDEAVFNLMATASQSRALNLLKRQALLSVLQTYARSYTDIRSDSRGSTGTQLQACTSRSLLDADSEASVVQHCDGKYVKSDRQAFNLQIDPPPDGDGSDAGSDTDDLDFQTALNNGFPLLRSITEGLGSLLTTIRKELGGDDLTHRSGLQASARSAPQVSARSAGHVLLSELSRTSHRRSRLLEAVLADEESSQASCSLKSPVKVRRSPNEEPLIQRQVTAPLLPTKPRSANKPGKASAPKKQKSAPQSHQPSKRKLPSLGSPTVKSSPMTNSSPELKGAKVRVSTSTSSDKTIKRSTTEPSPTAKKAQLASKASSKLPVAATPPKLSGTTTSVKGSFSSSSPTSSKTSSSVKSSNNGKDSKPNFTSDPRGGSYGQVKGDQGQGRTGPKSKVASRK